MAGDGTYSRREVCGLLKSVGTTPSLGEGQGWLSEVDHQQTGFSRPHISPYQPNTTPMQVELKSNSQREREIARRQFWNDMLVLFLLVAGLAFLVHAVRQTSHTVEYERGATDISQ